MSLTSWMPSPWQRAGANKQKYTARRWAGWPGEVCPIPVMSCCYWVFMSLGNQNKRLHPAWRSRTTERKWKVSIWVYGPIGAADAEQMQHPVLVSLVFTARAKLWGIQTEYTYSGTPVSTPQALPIWESIAPMVSRPILLMPSQSLFPGSRFQAFPQATGQSLSPLLPSLCLLPRPSVH